MNHTDFAAAENTITEKVGEVKEKVDETLSNVPSGTFLILAGGVLLASMIFKKKGAKMGFIGRWLTPIVLTGIYSKITDTFSNKNNHTPALAKPAYKSF